MRIVLLLALLSVGHGDNRFVGREGENVTLPCRYDRKKLGNLSFCWGRADIPYSGCNNKIIISTGGETESRYQLLGRLDEGDISMTIRNLTKIDAGRYGCRVEIPGWGNDAKHHFDLIVEEAPQTTTPAPNTETTTEWTTAGRSTGQVTSAESRLTSPSRSSAMEAETSDSAVVVVVCVLFGLIVLLTVCGVIVMVMKKRQLSKMPQQLHGSSTLQLQHRGSAVENIYQIDSDVDGEYDYVREPRGHAHWGRGQAGAN